MLAVERHSAAAAAEWDELARSSPMGTFLHTRAFLGYHGDRFEDVSALVRDESGGLLGVLPAAVDPSDAGVVSSHPGATFGGLVHGGALVGAAAIAAMEALAAHYRALGFARLRYMAVPFIYHRRPSQDDLYALFRLGALRSRCDLSCAVDLEHGAKLSSRRRRGLKRAAREAIEVSAGGAELVDELWPVVEANLGERHGARPVHTAAEMRALIELLPGEITVWLARGGGEPLAGVVTFASPRVVHAQYIASTPDGNASGALDAVFVRCIADAEERGARFFDFGTSNTEAGRVLNDGLYEFKSQFGGAGVAYEFYELELASTAAPKPVSP